MNKVILVISLFILSACGNTAERLSRIGKAPDFAKIELPIINDTAERDEKIKYTHTEVPKHHMQQKANALWDPSNDNFFRNKHNWRVGDIIKVVVDVSGSAKLDNTSQQTRSGKENVGIPSLFGKETDIAQILSKDGKAESLISTNNNRDHKGSGNISRKEDVQTEIAAMVTQVLPNGNLMIQGHQEVRVNYELREIKVAGIIRPKDISDTNSIKSEQIAEARISYGGRGIVSDVQQPRVGAQVLDIISPF